MTLGLILVIMNEARKPQYWEWMWAGSGDYTQTEDGLPESVDTRLPPKAPVKGEPGVIPLEVTPQIEEEAEREYFPGVDLEALAAVKDKTVHRGAEAESYQNLLGLLLDHDAEDFQKHLEAREASVPVTYRQLYFQPEVYRGHLVRLKGVVRAAREVRAPRNPFGIEKYYQVSLTPDPHNVVIVYVVELPDEFPVSQVREDRSLDQVREPVEMNAFFFKLWAYEAEQGISVAPLLLAKTFEWEKIEEPPPEPPPSMAIVLVMILGALALGLIVAGVVFMHGNWRTEASERTREAAVNPEAIESLNAIEAGPDSDEQFRQLVSELQNAESTASEPAEAITREPADESPAESEKAESEPDETADEKTLED